MFSSPVGGRTPGAAVGLAVDVASGVCVEDRAVALGVGDDVVVTVGVGDGVISGV